MGHHVVDMSKDPRSGQFAYFRGMTFPFAGLTVEMDITDMMAARGGRPFFLSMLYAVVRAANAVPVPLVAAGSKGAVAVPFPTGSHPPRFALGGKRQLVFFIADL